MSNILDPKFRYVPSHQTDIRKRFDALDPNWNKKPVKVERRENVRPIKVAK